MASRADRSPGDEGVRRDRGRSSERAERQQTQPMTGGRPEEVLSPEAAATWQAALERQRQMTWTLSRSVPLPHAEDIAQQAMMKAWVYLTDDEARPVENVGAWLRTISTNLLIDHKRRLMRLVEVFVEDHEDVLDEGDGDTPQSMRELHEKAFEMAKQLDGLVTPWEAKVVVLHKAYMLPTKDVAEMLQTTTASVRSTSHTAVRKLRAPDRKRQVLYRFGLTD
ncbi:RNA polymerase sigma factor [Streptomyces sp. NPDC003247]|uniref:RNA polymerase sigma factor n=1 Tax=Streptomyces sp. NPDC003247 TaxID=3364677 RepID=UPI0036A90164